MNKDIVSLIARHSTVLTRMSMAQVCKQWYQILGLKSVWEQETKKLDIQKIKTLAMICYNMRYADHHVHATVNAYIYIDYFVYLYPLIENSIVSIRHIHKNLIGPPNVWDTTIDLRSSTILNNTTIDYEDQYITCLFNRKYQRGISYIESSYIVNQRFNNKLI